MVAKNLQGLAVAACLAASLCASCGGGSAVAPAPTPNPNPNPGPGQPTVTLTASGVSPKELTVSPGARVLFTNNDTRSHEMYSDPHPEHTDCPEINQVGLISPGETKETGNLNTVRTCGFHDHNQPSNTSLQGRLIIRR